MIFIIDIDDYFLFIFLLRGGAWRVGIICIIIYNNVTDTIYCYRMFYLFLMKKNVLIDVESEYNYI